MTMHSRWKTDFFHRCAPPAGGLVLAVAVWLVACQTAMAVPQPYYFTAGWFSSSTAYSTHDPLNASGDVRTQGALWNTVGASGGTPIPITGVYIYDPTTAVDTTAGYTPSFPPAERRYAFPSPGTDATSLGGAGLPAGLTQMAYLTSGGKTFRTQPLPADGGTSEPSSMKVVNNGDVHLYSLSLGSPISYDYFDSLEFHTFVNVDPKNGPMTRDFSMAFIDGGFGLGAPPGSKAPTLPGSAIDGSNSTPPASLAFADLPLGPNAGWGGGSDGNSMSITAINRISFGDANGNGVVNATDFAALLAHYNQPANTYQINPGYSDAYTTAADWIGKAIWTMGDFNLDGVVNLDDYKVFLNPALISPGAALNFVPGDVNFDGIVNGQDIATIASHWLVSTIDGDANADGIVNGQDIATAASHWLQTFGGGGGSGAAVPEPSSLVLAAVAGLALVARRLRQRRNA